MIVLRRPAVGSLTLTLVTLVYVLAVTNRSFWSHAAAALSHSPASLAAFGVSICLLAFAALTVVSAPYVQKPVAILLVLAAAASSYFADRYGVIIDRDMIGNAVTTTSAEGGQMLTPSLFLHLCLYGLLPSAVIAAVRIRHRPFLRTVGRNAAVIVSCLVCAGLLIAANFASFAFVIREHRDVMALFHPAGPISAAVNYALEDLSESRIVAAPYGRDATVADAHVPGRKPRVLVVVAGETARAMNFSLNGYGRETNPELKALNVVNFTDATSCGTATAVSLPCMFSGFGREAYTAARAKGRENLTDVLKHAGIDVAWWDNNTGSKGVARLIDYASLNAKGDSPLCRGGECLDEIFLDGLEQKVAAATADTVIVIHQIGSHGPAYYRRYPDAYRRFTPDCRTAELMSCTEEEIVNAYDNTILYTDHVLAGIVRTLDRHTDRVAGAMVYMSDHGESLGENGLYLHGAPYAIAPVEQTHIPFLAWFSTPFQHERGLDASCLLAYSDHPMSHDNLFHTVLGMMDVRTTAYTAALDAFAPCTARGLDMATTGSEGRTQQ
ncbi:phosphoethanolamine transferase [Ensifer soli]|uniref:phosphoethanolamine transferase n=1 Tax=Ciceribacter sp. sgz301302 TaxID=3342379 RepID=UPI0035BB8B6F